MSDRRESDIPLQPGSSNEMDRDDEGHRVLRKGEFDQTDMISQTVTQMTLGCLILPLLIPCVPAVSCFIPGVRRTARETQLILTSVFLFSTPLTRPCNPFWTFLGTP